MTAPPSSEGAPAERGRLLRDLAIFLVALTPLLVTPVLPTIDFYDHAARYYVLSHLDDPFLAQNYAPRWAILPNIGMDVIGTALATFIPVLMLVKVLTVIIFAVQYFGLLYLNRKLTGQTSLLVALLGVPLLYSFIFTWGFANFLLGLGLALWGAGWWVATRHRLALAIPTSIVIATMIFLTHGFAFGLYGLLLGGLELGFFFRSNERSVAQLAKHLAGLATLAVVPALLFRSSATVKATEGVTNADEAVKRLSASGGLMDRISDLVIHRLTTVVRVSEGVNLWFDVLTNALVLGLVVVLARRRYVTLNPVVWPALAIGTVLFLIMPPALFGVGYVGDRIPLFVALAAVAALAVRSDNSRFYRGAMTILAVLVVVPLAARSVEWMTIREDHAAYTRILAKVPRHSLVTTANFANGNRIDSHRRCEMYGPLLVPAGYAAPLFVIPTAQPFSLIGPLRAAMAARPPRGLAPPSLDRAVNRFVAIANAGRFDYIVACEVNRVQLPASTPVDLAARDGRFSLYKVRKVAPSSAP